MSDYLDYHPAANLFPMMDKDAFAELCKDIGTNGLYEPIWLHEGKIIDGRNRYKACRALKVEPQFREWNGEGSLVRFVISLNATRRHLTATQKGLAAFHALPLLEAEAKDRQRLNGGDRKSEEYQESIQEILPTPIKHDQARDEAASLLGVSGKYVSDIKSIAKNAPDKMKAMESGKLTLQEAKKEILAEKSAPEKPPAPLKVDWKDVATQLKTALACIVHANNPETQQIAIEAGASLLDKLRG